MLEAHKLLCAGWLCCSLRLRQQLQSACIIKVSKYHKLELAENNAVSLRLADTVALSIDHLCT